jgi:hypothetical protein
VNGDLLVADADAGNAEMQYIWARLHGGKGPVLNKAISKKYYTLSAAQDNAEAQYNLAYYYEKTTSSAQNINKAVELYTLSASSGNHLAQNNLGLLMLSDRTGNKDVKKAIEWITKAAEGGNIFSQHTLGSSLCLGKYGLKKDLKAGTMWLRKSIDQGNLKPIRLYNHFVSLSYPKAERFALQIEVLSKGSELGHAYSMGWYGRMMINGDGIKKDRVEGVKWVQKSAALGDYHGLADLADIYRHGVGDVKRDFVKAVEIHKELAKKGHLVSMNNLGSIYYHGKGNVKKDYKLSAKYYQMNVDHGSERNLRVLGNIYRDGVGVDIDIEKAIGLYQRAIEVNQYAGYASIGDTYVDDSRGVKDIGKAMHNYTKGAELGDQYSQNALAEIYEKGADGVIVDLDEAIKLYRTAAKQKYEPAIEALKRLNAE